MTEKRQTGDRQKTDKGQTEDRKGTGRRQTKDRQGTDIRQTHGQTAGRHMVHMTGVTDEVYWKYNPDGELWRRDREPLTLGPGGPISPLAPTRPGAP